MTSLCQLERLCALSFLNVTLFAFADAVQVWTSAQVQIFVGKLEWKLGRHN